MRETAGTLRILIVDDSEASVQTLGWGLEMSGHEVRTARNAAEALRAMQDFVPEVVLLDITLPGMNGYDLCREMRRLPALARAVFIAQTGWGQEKHRRMSMEAGFDHHLVKPVEFRALEDLIRSLRLSRAA